MYGCTPYGKESVELNDMQDYQDWLAAYKEDEYMENQNVDNK